jgi:hypothetical protein
MRKLLVTFAVAGLVAWAAPAFAQESSGGNAGGGSTGGSSRSTLRVRTSGGAAVGVSQGSVAAGSRASGCNGGDCSDQAGTASSGGGGGGQTAGAVSAPANAVEDGVVNNASLPALELGESQSAADRRPSVLIWAIAGAILLGMVVLYRRLPRPTPAS